MPVWGVLLGDRLWFGTAGQRARNLRHQPYAIIHHESADDVAIIEGRVTRRPLAEAPAAVVAAFREKYVDPTTGGPFDLVDLAAGDAAGEEAWLYELRIEVGRAWLEGAFQETDTR